MPTIHIHSDDASVIAAIVANLLSYGQRVRFHGDNDDVFDVTTSEAWQTAHDSTFETRTEIGARLMDEIAAHEREKAWSHYQDRRARWETDNGEYEFNLGVNCPHCLAPVDMPCLDPRGNDKKRPYVHSVRRRDARKATYHPDETIDDWGPKVEAIPAGPEWAKDYNDLDEM